MPPIIRLATPEDIPRLVELLLLDADERLAEGGILWKMADDASAQIEKALTFALTSEQQPFRHKYGRLRMMRAEFRASSIR